MSDYAVHLTRPEENDDGLSQLVSILSVGEIRAVRAFGLGAGLDAPRADQRCACLSEIPLGYLGRLVDQRNSAWGLAFRQSKLLAHGGGRVWYVDEDSELETALKSLKAEAMGPPLDQVSPFWTVSRFVDVVRSRDSTYQFEWEREWRVPGGLQFEPSEVAFLLAPEEFHDGLALAASNWGDGQSYDAPIVDPTWGVQKLEAAMRQ
ncbi:MAG: hypothetical protein AAGA37_01880 [Actinomycetota bacterium]